MEAVGEVWKSPWVTKVVKNNRTKEMRTSLMASFNRRFVFTTFTFFSFKSKFSAFSSFSELSSSVKLINQSINFAWFSVSERSDFSDFRFLMCWRFIFDRSKNKLEPKKLRFNFIIISIFSPLFWFSLFSNSFNTI